jgi:hypothetical protein
MQQKNAFDDHVCGCVALHGVNATAKHDTITAFFARLCRDAGVPYAKEPRAFEAHRCRGCKLLVQSADLKAHKALCKSAVDRTGPDLVIHWAEGAIVYDVTVAHTTAPSHLQTPVAEILRRKIEHKATFYTEMCKPFGFAVLPVTAHGRIPDETAMLLKRLARACGRTGKDVITSFSVTLQRLNGEILVNAQRGHARSDTWHSE